MKKPITSRANAREWKEYAEHLEKENAMHLMMRDVIKEELKRVMEKIRLADAIIHPASEILPDTYSAEIIMYLNYKL